MCWWRSSSPGRSAGRPYPRRPARRACRLLWSAGCTDRSPPSRLSACFAHRRRPLRCRSDPGPARLCRAATEKWPQAHVGGLRCRPCSPTIFLGRCVRRSITRRKGASWRRAPHCSAGRERRCRNGARAFCRRTLPPRAFGYSGAFKASFPCDAARSTSQTATSSPRPSGSTPRRARRAAGRRSLRRRRPQA